MSYLQLADNSYTSLAEEIIAKGEQYVFIPQGFRGAAKDLYVREDLFDNLPESTYNELMNSLERYQNTGLSAGKGKERRAARKDARVAKKSEKVATRDVRKDKRAARFGGIVDKVGGIVGGIMGGQKELDVTAGGGGLDISYNDEPQESWISRNKIPVAIGAVVLIGGGIYLATRKKRK